MALASTTPVLIVADQSTTWILIFSRRGYETPGGARYLRRNLVACARGCHRKEEGYYSALLPCLSVFEYSPGHLCRVRERLRGRARPLAIACARAQLRTPRDVDHPAAIFNESQNTLILPCQTSQFQPWALGPC